MKENTEELEKIIGWEFNDKSLLEEALTHSSYAFEKNIEDNEKLEFFGDSVFGYVVSEYIYKNYKNLTEGEMSKLKAIAVGMDTIFKLSKKLELGRYLILGKGEEKSKGRKKKRIVVSAFEALVGALSIDAGIELTRDFIIKLMGNFFSDFEKGMVKIEDPKSELQEYVQKSGLSLPEYRIIKEEGPNHLKVFYVELNIGEKKIAEGRGRSKKQAEQRAAKKALELLKKANQK
ncbi:MAG: ribonuclease III [Acidobacteriota bacterium]